MYKKKGYKLSKTDTLYSIIDCLHSEKVINKKEFDFVDKVRDARNDWLHEAKNPKPELIEQLIQYLEKKQSLPCL